MYQSAIDSIKKKKNEEVLVSKSVWEVFALVDSPARLHSNALDTFRSSCSHHY